MGLFFIIQVLFLKIKLKKYLKDKLLEKELQPSFVPPIKDDVNKKIRDFMKKNNKSIIQYLEVYYKFYFIYFLILGRKRKNSKS